MFSMKNYNSEYLSKNKNPFSNIKDSSSLPSLDDKLVIDKISQVFKLKYEEIFINILCEDQMKFLQSLYLSSMKILKEIIPSKLFSNTSIKEALKAQEVIYYQEYTKNYKLLSSSWNDYEIHTKTLMKYSQQLSQKNNDNFSFVKQYRKHCVNCPIQASHSCSKSSKLLEVTDKKDNITHVICTECKRVFLSSSIELYCYQCNASYLSCVIPSNESPDIQPTTWAQYHCGVVLNQTMKCIKCRALLYINLKTTLLMCLNKKCNFISKPNAILWNCVFCKKDFRSEAKIYNVLEFNLIKKAISFALLLQKKASPNELNCCKEVLKKESKELSVKDFIHKADCSGLLYKGELNGKEIIVCGKCHGMNFADKFLWTCPYCHMRSKAKMISTQSQVQDNKEEENYALKGDKNCFRSSLEVFSPQKMKRDITSIVSPNYQERNNNRKGRYSTLKEILEKREQHHYKQIPSTINGDKDEEKEDYIPISTEPNCRLILKKKINHDNNDSIDNDGDANDNDIIDNNNDNADDDDDNNNENEYQYHTVQTECCNNKESQLSTSEILLKKLLLKSHIPSFNLIAYDVIKPVGEGSFGKIYLVHNKKTKQSFALKKIIAHSLTEIKQFKREFELVYSVQHKNIMKIFNINYKSLDFSTYSIYVLMELANKDWNSEIQSRIKSKQYYKESELISILKQLTSSLSFLQKKSISHRDIKPQNVLLYDNSVYKVADFGEAKEVKISKGQSTLKGTELYMSPVLYNGLRHNLTNVAHDPYKSDVFSLGYCVLYASTLSFSFLTDIREITDIKIIFAKVSQYFKGKYSNGLLNVILRMLEIDEIKRYDFLMLEKALENI